MPNLVCEDCGRTFFQYRGRPARRCQECRTDSPDRYGQAHQELREQLAPFVEGMECARCGQPIHGAWQLDHADDGSGRYLGPSHRRCNAKAGALKLIQRKERAYKLVKAAEAAGVDLSKFVTSARPAPAAPAGGKPKPTTAAPSWEDGWCLAQPRRSGEELRTLMGAWNAATERWHEAMREAIRLDDGGGDHDVAVKAADLECDAAYVAWLEATGQRTVGDRKQHWTGERWVDVGPRPWW